MCECSSAHLVLRVNARELELRLLEAAVALVVGAHRARNVPPEVEKDVHEVVVALPLREQRDLDARHHVLRAHERHMWAAIMSIQ